MRSKLFMAVIALTFVCMVPAAAQAQTWWWNPEVSGAGYDVAAHPSRILTILDGAGESCNICELSVGHGGPCPNQDYHVPVQTINALIGTLVAAEAMGTTLLVVEDNNVCEGVSRRTDF